MLKRFLKTGFGIWREQANIKAARDAGFAYEAYVG